MARFVMVVREPISRDLSWFNHRRKMHAGHPSKLRIPPSVSYAQYVAALLHGWHECAASAVGRSGSTALPLRSHGAEASRAHSADDALYAECYGHTRPLNVSSSRDGVAAAAAAARVKDLLHGAYVAQLRQWSEQFSRAQVTVLAYDGLQDSPTEHQAAFFAALDLPVAKRDSGRARGAAKEVPRANAQKSSPKTGFKKEHTIPCATRAKLAKFFKPWNAALYQMEPSLPRWRLDEVACV